MRRSHLPLEVVVMAMVTDSLSPLRHFILWISTFGACIAHRGGRKVV